MIVYFTGTGNSRYAARLLAEQTGDALYDVRADLRAHRTLELASEVPWVFVSPTHAWRLPRSFERLLASAKLSGARAAYFVLTCGTDIGNAGHYAASLCRALGLEYRGTCGIVMPENYVAMFPVPDETEAARIVEAARPEILRAGDVIRGGGRFADARPKLADRLKSGPVHAAFYRFCMRSRPFYATERCIGCGQCAARCPGNAIRLRDGRPVWSDGCIHCMACICLCPVSAVEYGKKSLGKPRYRGPGDMPPENGAAR